MTTARKNGACGVAKGVATPIRPVADQLCGAGTPTDVKGSGPWSWSCLGEGGGETVSCSAPLLPPGYYVAPMGSDANPGTLNAPFATLPRAQKAMQASSTIKTTYVRAGTYHPTAITHSNCFWGNAAGASVSLDSRDSGETWSYYPPDGYGSAVLDGGSTVGNSGGKGGNGTGCGFGAYGASDLTIVGLEFENYLYAALFASDASHAVFQDNIVHETTAAAWGVGGVALARVPNSVVDHNYMYNLAYPGVSIGTDASLVGGNSNDVVSNNVILNSCTWPAVAGFGNDQNGGDCSAIYFIDSNPTQSTNVSAVKNYVRDVNVTSESMGDAEGRLANGIYLDNGTGNMTLSGNVITGHKVGCFFIHGGNDNTLEDNICDLSDVSYQNIVTYQQNKTDYAMTGNTFRHNIVVSSSSAPGRGFLGLGKPPHAMTIRDNNYYNYVGASVSSEGTGGAGSDTNPTIDNPLLRCWGAQLSSTSPTFEAPVDFPAQGASWDTRGFWGPPTWTMTESGTAPSWPLTSGDSVTCSSKR
jgi:parallel beta-helix repeat protein